MDIEPGPASSVEERTLRKNGFDSEAGNFSCEISIKYMHDFDSLKNLISTRYLTETCRSGTSSE